MPLLYLALAGVTSWFKYSPQESLASGMCMKIILNYFYAFQYWWGEEFFRKGGQEALMDGRELKGVFRRNTPKSAPEGVFPWEMEWHIKQHLLREAKCDPPSFPSRAALLPRVGDKGQE